MRRTGQRPFKSRVWPPSHAPALQRRRACLQEDQFKNPRENQFSSRRKTSDRWWWWLTSKNYAQMFQFPDLPPKIPRAVSFQESNNWVRSWDLVKNAQILPRSNNRSVLDQINKYLQELRAGIWARYIADVARVGDLVCLPGWCEKCDWWTGWGAELTQCNPGDWSRWCSLFNSVLFSR